MRVEVGADVGRMNTASAPIFNPQPQCPAIMCGFDKAQGQVEGGPSVVTQKLRVRLLIFVSYYLVAKHVVRYYLGFGR